MKRFNNNIYLHYSIIFLVINISLLAMFILLEKNFVWLNDGIASCIVELKSAGGLFSGSGDEIYSNYGLTENNTVFRFFYWGIRAIPASLFGTNALIAYSIIIFLLQAYFSGIAFIYFCRYKNIGSSTAQLVSTIIYVFCGYFIYCMHQPVYGHTVVFLPLLAIGIEKIIDARKGTFFSIMTALATSCCVTYIYPITAVLAIYILVVLYENASSSDALNIIKYYIKNTGIIVVYWFVGFLCAGVLLIPMAYGINNSFRMQPVISTDSLFYYSLEDYARFALGIFDPVSRGFETWITLSIFVFLAIFILCFYNKHNEFQRKKRTSALILSLTSIILYMIPLWGFFTKGFANISNYWYFGLFFFVAYACIFAVDMLVNINHKKRFYFIFGLFIFSYGLLLMHIFSYPVNQFPIIWLGLMYAAVIVILIIRNNKYKKLVLISFVVLNVGTNMNIATYSILNNYLDAETSLSDYYSQFPDSAAAYIDDDSFYRIDKYNFSGEYNLNLPQWYGYNGLSVFHSVIMKQPYEYFCETENNGLIVNNKISDLDNRAMPEVLANVKYFLSPTQCENYVPYGYELHLCGTGDGFNTDIYKSKYDLSLGYTYSSDASISESDADKYNALEKQEIMMQYPIVNSNIRLYSNSSKYQITSSKLPFKVKPSNNVEIVGDSIHVKESGHITILIEQPGNSEIYIRVGNLNPGEENRYYNIACGDINKQIMQIESGNFHKIERNAVMVNLGYQKKRGKIECQLEFITPGEYKLSGITVFSQSMDKLDYYVENLMHESLQVTYMDRNIIEGNIKVSDRKWLCLSLPYSKGWSIFVDDKKVDTYCLNYMYLGVLLEEGEHHIRLEYQISGMRLGMICTVISLMILLALYYIERKRVEES